MQETTQEIHCSFETKVTRQQKSKTGVSVASIKFLKVVFAIYEPVRSTGVRVFQNTEG